MVKEERKRRRSPEEINRKHRRESDRSRHKREFSPRFLIFFKIKI